MCLAVSIGCINDNTYGLSCVKCEKCGRKFTMEGVDDSKIIMPDIIHKTNIHILEEKIELVNDQIVLS